MNPKSSPKPSSINKISAITSTATKAATNAAKTSSKAAAKTSSKVAAKTSTKAAAKTSTKAATKVATKTSTRKASTKKAGTTARSQRQLSNIVKPSEQTLKEWQIQLREQEALKETFAISDEGRGRYLVRNASAGRSYEVTWICKDHPLNGCTCMDFRTSRLGTCKHMEAVKNHIKGRRRKRIPATMEHTVMYVDYSGQPKICLFYAGKDHLAISQLAQEMLNGHASFSTDQPEFLLLRAFISCVREKGLEMECRPDVLELIDSTIDRNMRMQRLTDGVFNREDWWKDFLNEQPFEYQKEGIKSAVLSGHCLIADEMGLGKTIQAIGAASILYKEGYVDSILVVCPTSLKYQWQKEITKFSGMQSIVIEGIHTVRRRLYDADCPIKIVSYNSLSNDMKVMKGLSVDMVIMDEVQRLKNWNTQIARGARMVSAEYRIILSGTPLENKLEELYSVVQLADQYILGPYYEFRDRHIAVDSGGKVIGYRNLNEVGKKLRPIMIRRRKADVHLQLPPRLDKNLFVPMTNEQMEMHDEFKAGVAGLVQKWRRAHFLSETDRRRLLLLLSEMRMVCDSTYILDQKSRYDTKVDEAVNIISSVVESGDGKVVLFSQWERMTRLVAAELEKAGIGYEYLHGGVPSAKRKDLMDRFNESPDVRVFISTDAGSTGLNLQKANYIINMDLPWNPAVLEQRIGRIYRIGQERNIQVINLISANTIEEQMLTKLRFKASMFAGALDNGDDEVLLEGGKLKEIIDQLDFETVGTNSAANTPAAETEEAAVKAEASTPAGKCDSEVEAGAPDGKYGSGAVAGASNGKCDSEAVAGAPAGKCDSKAVAVDGDSSGNPRNETPENSKTPGDGHPEATSSEIKTADIISAGANFLGSLMNILKTPESASKMVDDLVIEDKDTGKTSINIPVKDKETVRQFVTLLGKLLQ